METNDFTNINEDTNKYEVVDFNYFFKPLDKRGNHNHGLIACFNSFDEKSVEFLKKYTNEAYLNGEIDKDYLDLIPQDQKLMKMMDRIMNETEEYRCGLFLLKLFPMIDLETLNGISSYASKMLINFSIEYQKLTRPGDYHTYMNEGWYIVGQYMQKYNKILKLIPKAKKTKYPLKFLYYGRPTITAYLFFYILIRNYCDVVIVSPKDYNYKDVAYEYLHKWLEYNIPVESFENSNPLIF